MLKISTYIYAVLYMLIFVKNLRAEFYTAVAELEELYKTEKVLNDFIKQIVKVEDNKILKRHVEDYERRHNNTQQNVESYVTNPLNAFVTIKRLATDWEQIEKVLFQNVYQQYLHHLNTFKQTLNFPTSIDVAGAAAAITRLQDAYGLDTAELARGELYGRKISAEMTPNDCYELGRRAYEQGEREFSLQWMEEADKTILKQHDPLLKNTDLQDYLQFIRRMENDESTTNAPQYSPEVAQYLDEMDYKYKKLCRREILQPLSVQSQLRCLYMNNNNPFLLIGPFKVEEANREPPLHIYHDVLYDSEIDTITNMSRSRIARALVQDEAGQSIASDQSRVGKFAWFEDGEHEHVARITQRVEDMTGYSTQTAEQLQVVNYGIGGHFRPHNDYLHENSDLLDVKGNRLATVLFYMNDVTLGGATVFLNMETAIYPKKGTAAVWVNMLPNGGEDENTMHAACPVILGSKWITTKWIRAFGQELRKPCRPV